MLGVWCGRAQGKNVAHVCESGVVRFGRAVRRLLPSASLDRPNARGTLMSDPNSNVMSGPLLLADLSSPETAALLPSIDLVLIPVGAHEQHGPNIAVSTDTVSA